MKSRNVLKKFNCSAYSSLKGLTRFATDFWVILPKKSVVYDLPEKSAQNPGKNGTKIFADLNYSVIFKKLFFRINRKRSIAIFVLIFYIFLSMWMTCLG